MTKGINNRLERWRARDQNQQSGIDKEKKLNKINNGQTNLLRAIEDSKIVPELCAGADDSGCYGSHEETGDSRARRLGMVYNKWTGLRGEMEREREGRHTN